MAARSTDYLSAMPSSFWPGLIDRFQALLPARFRARRPVVPVLRLSGVIGGASPFRPGLTLSACAGGLERAFSTPRAKAVALLINSPGGSAVQSHLIYKRIRALSAEKQVSVLAFVEDAAASGGYMLACAADEIFADPSSLVGSIGVVSAGFGFDRLIERFGIERRVHTAGTRKAMLDPFRPEQPEDVARLEAIQRQVQETFVALVRSRRGSRLHGEADTLFSGLIWAGEEAKELGLVDGIGDLRAVLRERYGEEVELKAIPLGRPSLLGRWRRRGEPLIEAGAPPAGLVAASDLMAALDERAAWARLGL